ncbi:hypothetical protein QBC47DRAFT_388233 [Echria macrotheca]|uniref:Uncharacterized protein n=1 Tax=Echria macrotheca TaxID=438768 RepID=A0AAJ0B7X8_9PEZI|nr:hypothetical protein QBC47DRAFT_388233 [Echria macrotheca]
MSLEKITANFLGLSQETSLALANLRFDFSLFKVEAPSEFQGLGRELTSARKKAAEDGTPHITARKLGALFQHVLPSTPALIQAYGKRATEIASCPAVNPKGSRAHGLFADHVGIDGTSIWAAATSGPESVAAHLLACMLARMWSVPEAIAIWDELVARRRKDLANVGETEANFLEAQMASRISLSRDQLAEWDASARAWLRAADQAMGTKQKQLMLILNNLNLPVNKNPTMYKSVLDAWTSSMTAANQLIEGMPLSIHDGGVLLGLASWHLYPDILVLGKGQTEVCQHDPVVATGGILTIGLKVKSEEQTGIRWSLPLSHLRYYGRAVLSERSLDTQANRITIDQLMLVALGSLTRSWGMTPVQIAQDIGLLWEAVSLHAKGFCAPGTPHWLGLFANSTLPLLGPDSLEKKTAMQLMKFGSKRATNFVLANSYSGTETPLFGLHTFRGLFPALTLEGKINVLRSLVDETRQSSRFQWVIQYRLGGMTQYASVKPITHRSGKRDAEGAEIKSAGHMRWLRDISDEDIARFANLRESLSSVDDLGPLESTTSTGEPTFSLTSAGKFGINPYSNFVFFAGDSDTGLFWDFDPHSSNIIGPVPSSPDHLITRSGSFKEIISRGWISPGRCLVQLAEYVDKPLRTSMKVSLRALATLSRVYKLLPEATISLGISSSSLYSMPWAQQPPAGNQNPRPFSIFPPSWQRTFSCIMTMESGSLAFPLETFEKVMAISAGDSLYIAAPLLCDPAETPDKSEIHRIVGNVGGSGIALLIPPADPEFQDYDPSSWKLIDHKPFDGRLENSFVGTSLHLSFTGYTMPVDTDDRGFRDKEVCYMETRITVHDQGKEVGDLDILGNLDHEFGRRFHLVAPCSHASPAQSRNPEAIDNPKVTTIDNWAELIDKPETVAIARSNGNWLGRLALAIAGLQLGHRVVVTPNTFCWACITEAAKHFSTGSTRSRPLPRDPTPDSDAEKETQDEDSAEEGRDPSRVNSRKDVAQQSEDAGGKSDDDDQDEDMDILDLDILGGEHFAAAWGSHEPITTIAESWSDRKLNERLTSSRLVPEARDEDINMVEKAQSQKDPLELMRQNKVIIVC